LVYLVKVEKACTTEHSVTKCNGAKATIFQFSEYFMFPHVPKIPDEND